MTNADLLDPRASDRYLRAYALLASEYAAGAKTAVDSLLPFVRRAVFAHRGEAYDAKQLSSYVQDTYRVKVPIYMMDAFKNKLLEEGGVVRSSHAPEAYICAARNDGYSETPKTSWTQEELAEFEAALASFAREIDEHAPYASEGWSEALIKFFAGTEDRKSASINRQLIYDVKRVDDRIVSAFIASLDRGSAQYEIAKKLYYGVLVADFFTCINELSAGGTLTNVAVVLDTTLLMRLLGTSGLLLKDATLELVSDIQNLGGRAFYYAHSYEEMIENLEALRDRLDNRADINRETSHAIATGETSLTAIRLLINEADSRLGALSITQHPIDYRRTQNQFQIDEEGFVRKVGGARYEEHRIRWERDAMSLALTMRQRRGNVARSLGQCEAIFITHNGKLARMAAEFVGASSFEVPPVLTTDQVSVLSWLERGGGLNDAELSSKLAAACYEAVIPREGWEAQFWARLDELKDSSEEYKSLLSSQVTTNAIRATVLDKSYGEPSLARQLDLEAILREAAANAEREVREASESGRIEGLKQAGVEVDNRLLRRSASLARAIVATVWLFFLAAVLVLYLVPAVSSALNPDDRSWKYFFNVGFAALLSIVAIVGVFGRNTSIAGFARWMEKRLGQMIFSVLKAITS